VIRARGTANRRLSPLDASFLYLERRHQLLHVGCVALLEGGVPWEAFVTSVGERLAAIPRYRQRPVRPTFDLGWPTWEDDPHFDVRRHLRRVAVPTPGGEAELCQLVDALFAAPLDAAHPLWETVLIEGLAAGRAAFLCKVHHCMIDGVSGAQVLEVMTDAVAGVAPPDPVARPAASSPAPVSAVSSALATVVGGARRAVATATGAASMFASFVREPVSALSFNGPLSDRRRVVWTSFPLDDFLAMRGAGACKVNDVVLAVIAGALRRYVLAHGTPGDVPLRVRAMVPVSLRRDADRLSLGNLVSAMFPFLPVDVADPRERLQRIAAEMRGRKEAGEPLASGILMGAVGLLPAPVNAFVGRLLPDSHLVNTVCTNVPGPREPRQLLGRRVLDVHPLVPIGFGMGIEFAILSYADRLSITATADADLAPDAERLRLDLLDAEAELRAALGVPAARPAVDDPVGGWPVVADLMTPDPVTIAAEASLLDANREMRRRRIRHLPVVDGAGAIVGLVTHRDLLAAAPSSLAFLAAGDPAWLLQRARVADVMETHLSVAEPRESAADAGARMVRHKIGCLPVVGSDGRLAGILTQEDFLRWATERMAPTTPGDVRRSA